MTRCLVLIAVSGADAGAWQERHIASFPGRVVVVTPRSIQAARGVTAFAVLVTDAAADHPRLQEMLEESMPTVLAQVLR